jgi:hypothetical protein
LRHLISETEDRLDGLSPVQSFCNASWSRRANRKSEAA